MKKEKYVIFIVILFFAAMFFLCQRISIMEEQKRPYGLFSWEEEVLLAENRKDLFHLMEDYGLNELYQNIPEAIDSKILCNFLEEAASRKISVFLLCGDPRWGLDQNGKKVTAEIRRAVYLNEQLEEKASLAGVMLDVEPYLTKEWQENPEWVMKRYVSAMKAAFQEAEDTGLKMIACIPYFYDSKGFSEALEELIAHGCHAVAVMNYYKGSEFAHIQTELALAEKNEKPIMTIYELQSPGKYGVEDKNTYYDDGMDAVMNNWMVLDRVSKSNLLSYGIHHYEALREVNGREYCSASGEKVSD